MKNFIYLLAVLMTSIFIFSSCDSDDDVTMDYATKVTGTYMGSVNLTMSGNNLGDTSGESMVIERAGDNKVNVIYKNWSYHNNTYGDVKVDAVEVSTDGKNNLTGNTETSFTMNSKEYPATVSVSGNVEGTSAEVIFTINLVISEAMKHEFVLTFTGGQTVGTVTLDATDYKKWVYYSFEKGKQVEVTDPLTDLSWDIALHRYDTKTNSGISGNGKGGALETVYNSFAEVKTIPSDGYVVDESGEINMSGMPPVYTEGTMNLELNKWMDLDTSNMPPAYTMSDNVYIVRTAAGKYAKVKFLDYSDDADVKAHITFMYEYPVE